MSEDTNASSADRSRSRRLAILRVDPQFFVDLFKTGGRVGVVVEKGLPSDARIRGVAERSSWRYTGETATIDLVVESESFEEVHLGELLPILPSPVLSTR